MLKSSLGVPTMRFSDNDLVLLAVSTGLVVSNNGRGGSFVSLSNKGRRLGLYPTLCELVTVFIGAGIDASVGGTCPRWGWLRVTKDGFALGSNGDFPVNVRSV